METQNDERKRDLIPDDPSPRCVLEIPILSPESDHSSNSNSAETLVPEGEATKEGNLSQWKNLLDTFKKKSMRRFSMAPLLANYDIITKRSLKRKLTKMQNSPDMMMIDWGGMPISKPSWRNFDYAELEAATDNFSSGKKMVSQNLFLFHIFLKFCLMVFKGRNPSFLLFCLFFLHFSAYGQIFLFEYMLISTSSALLCSIHLGFESKFSI